MLKVPVTRYEEVDRLEASMKLKKGLWQGLHDWGEQVDGWSTAPFESLDTEGMQAAVNKYNKVCAQCEKGLPPNTVLPLLREKVDVFKALVPVVVALRNGALKEHHWAQIEEAIHAEIDRGDNFTLGYLLELQVNEHREAIETVSTAATQEGVLEEMLAKVDGAWKQLEFTVNLYKEQKDIFILGSMDDVLACLEETQARRPEPRPGRPRAQTRRSRQTRQTRQKSPAPQPRAPWPHSTYPCLGPPYVLQLCNPLASVRLPGPTPGPPPPPSRVLVRSSCRPSWAPASSVRCRSALTSGTRSCASSRTRSTSGSTCSARGCAAAAPPTLAPLTCPDTSLSLAALLAPIPASPPPPPCPPSCAPGTSRVYSRRRTSRGSCPTSTSSSTPSTGCGSSSCARRATTRPP